mgnify:CR=1 FL=1
MQPCIVCFVVCGLLAHLHTQIQIVISRCKQLGAITRLKGGLYYACYRVGRVRGETGLGRLRFVGPSAPLMKAPAQPGCVARRPRAGSRAIAPEHCDKGSHGMLSCLRSKCAQVRLTGDKVCKQCRKALICAQLCIRGSHAARAPLPLASHWVARGVLVCLDGPAASSAGA